MKTIPQSAAIPFLKVKGTTNLVLVTSNSTGAWIIPKGLVEPDLTPAESAAKEAWEEAGVRGQISDEVVATYHYRKWGGICEVQVFALAVSEILDEWDEMHTRDRCVVKLSDAIGMVKEELKDVLRAFETQQPSTAAD